MNNWVAYHPTKVHRSTLNVNTNDEEITITTGSRLNHSVIGHFDFLHLILKNVYIRVELTNYYCRWLSIRFNHADHKEFPVP